MPVAQDNNRCKTAGVLSLVPISANMRSVGIKTGLKQYHYYVAKTLLDAFPFVMRQIYTVNDVSHQTLYIRLVWGQHCTLHTNAHGLTFLGAETNFKANNSN